MTSWEPDKVTFSRATYWAVGFFMVCALLLGFLLWLSVNG